MSPEVTARASSKLLETASGGAYGMGGIGPRGMRVGGRGG